MAEAKEKVFVCDICRHKPEFTAKSSLQRHIKSFHSEIKPEFKCPLCNSTYSRKDHLDRHIRTLHKKEPNVVYREAQEAKQEAKQEEPKSKPKSNPKPKPKQDPLGGIAQDQEVKQEVKQEETKEEIKAEPKPPRVLPDWVGEVDKIKKSLLRQPKKIVIPTLPVKAKAKTQEFLEKERIRQQKIRDKKYEEEGRIQHHYNKQIIEGESKEDRARRLKSERQARWRARVKEGKLN